MKKLVSGIVALMMLPALASAAEEFGTIQGNVSDSSGRPVVGALVTVATAGPATLDRMVFTDSRGGFSFEKVRSGDYSVQVTMMPRFTPSQKEKLQLAPGSNANLKFRLQTIAEASRRAVSHDAKDSQDIDWILRSSRGTQSVLRYSDSAQIPKFSKLLPDYSGYVQFYSKADPGARTAPNTKGSRFSVTMGQTGGAKVTFAGQYNESPLETRGASALYEFSPAEGHTTRIGLNVRQGVILDDTFSAEDLKEFQAEYSDKFYLSDKLIAEQGVQIGHAEGRSSNNYLRPQGRLSWLADSRTVFSLAASTQAPGRADDPVRGREYFEQVNLPPSFEHYLHTEVGVSRSLDEETKASMAVFEDRTNNRALFVSAPDGRQGLFIVGAKSMPSRGMRLFVNHDFYGFQAGLGYTVASGSALPSSSASLDELRQQVYRRPFHVVTARVKTDFDLTDTELTAVYRWISRSSIGPVDPYQQMVEYNDPTLSISVAQNLPTFGAIPAKVQAIFDARNLFEQPFGSSKTQFAHSPRFVKGGINIRF